MTDGPSRRRTSSPGRRSRAPATLHGLTVIRRLGQGRSATAWEAACARRGTVVALRHEHGCLDCSVSPEVLPQGDLRHPFLIDVHAAAPGVTLLELARGGPVDRWLRRPHAGSASRVTRVARIGAQVASALSFLHGRGHVHRDVKPSNILVVPGAERGDDGWSVRLSDFDLMMSRGQVSHRARVAGTPAFMAPEQHRGDAVDERADLHALGATLLSLLTGALPFPADDESGLLAAKLACRPRLPADPTPAETGLLRLLLPLLEPHPAQRARDAADVRDRLAELAGSESVSGSCGRIVQRDHERAELAQLVEQALRGCSGSALVTGPPGSGRSALLAEVEHYARARGLMVHQGSRQRRPVPGAILLVDDLPQLGQEAATRLLDAAGGLTLRGPDAAGQGAVLVLTCDLGGPDSSWLGRRVEALVAAGSLHVRLEPLTSAGTEEYVLACVAAPERRHADAARELHAASGGLPSLLSALSQGAVARAGSLEASLQRLSPAELQQLQMIALSTTDWSERDPGLTPVAIQTLVARRLLRRQPNGHVRLAAASLGAAAIAALSPEERQSLARRLLATLPSALRTRKVLALAIEAGDLERIVASLGVVLGGLKARRNWNTLAPLLRRLAGIRELPAAARARVRCLAAELLLATGALEQATQASAEAVSSAEDCGQSGARAAALRVALEVALAAYDEPAARAASERLLALARSTGRAADHVRALIALGRQREALAAARRTGDRVLIAEGRLAMARAAQQASDHRQARAGYLAAARGYRAARRTLSESSCYVGLGRLAFAEARQGDAEKWWRRALTVAGPDAPRSHLLTIEFNLGVTLQLSGAFEDAGRMLRSVLERCEAGGDHRRAIDALTALMNVESQQFGFDAARAAGGRALELSARLGEAGLAALVRANLGDIARIVGDDDAGEQHCIESVRLARAAGATETLAVSLRNHAELLLRRALVLPRWRPAAVALLDAAAEALAGEAPGSEIALEIELDRLVVSLPAPAAARTRLPELVSEGRARGLPDLERKARNACISLWLQLGDRGRARVEALSTAGGGREESPTDATLFSLALCAVLDVGPEPHRRLADTLADMLHRLGPEDGASYLGRNDVAAALHAALATGLERDPLAAQALVDALRHNAAFGWRADVLVGNAAAAQGRPGVALFRWSRARRTLAEHPELALEARLDPDCALLLASLDAGLPRRVNPPGEAL